MSQDNANDVASLSARSRPQYHYFYGSTDADNMTEATNEQEQESLIGEELMATDQEGDTPPPSEHDLQHLIITNGNSAKPWFFGSTSRETGAASGLGWALLAILLLATFGTFLVLLLPHSSQKMTTAQSIAIPFPYVDREDYGDPVKEFIDLDLFHPTLLSRSEPHTFVFPFPTGAFWTNLVMKSNEGGASYPIVVYPYAYKWDDSYLQVSYPAAHRSAHKLQIVDSFQPELTFTAAEEVKNRYITNFDPLSVTLRFVATDSSRWESSLVQGSPYTTIKYLNATPLLKALSTFKTVLCPGDDEENFSDLLDNDYDDDSVDSDERRRLFGVCSIDDSTPGVTLMRGVQFMFKSAEGVSWIMFSSEPMNLEFDNRRRTVVKSSSPFTGIIRLAYIPAKQADAITETSTGLRRLIYHAGVYPVGGQVTWEFHNQANSKDKSQTVNSTSRFASFHISYATHTLTDNSLRPNAATDALLMFALPHHAQLLPKHVRLTSKHFDLEYRSIKGPLTPVIGASWTYDEPILDLKFDEPAKNMDVTVRQTILDQIAEDITILLPTRTENVYGFGKQVARLAQLAYIASRLQRDESDDEAGSLVNQATSALGNYLEMYLTNQVTDGLLFDANLGGIVSTNGLYNKGEDFGNGRYNDHHFHYGYILYASAIMAKLNSSFVGELGVHVDSILHDVAHPSNGDSREVKPGSVFLPMSRHKSWFDGHSFATGLFQFGDGKSQESSSEAVNCYYGAYLWSMVRHGKSGVGSDMTDFTSLLLATEVRAARTYWHMIPPSVVGKNSSNYGLYTPEFEENYMVGNVGMLDVTANTWFGNDPQYVHMINAIPITSATAVLFDKNYVKYEYPYLMGSRGSVEMAWRGYTLSIKAIIDPQGAWKEAQDLVSHQLDSALSKSQVLYWISQRPLFMTPWSAVTNMTTSNGNQTAHGSNPTAATTNTKLGIVSAEKEKSTVNKPSAGSKSGDSTCEAHRKCTDLMLIGQCCPTPDGTKLDCCGQ